MSFCLWDEADPDQLRPAPAPPVKPIQADASALLDRMAAALEGVIRVADRKTEEFDRAREALREYEATFKGA